MTCEYYLGVLSHLGPEPLWLGSTPGLTTPGALAAAAISHVLLLCRAAGTANAVSASAGGLAEAASAAAAAEPCVEAAGEAAADGAAAQGAAMEGAAKEGAAAGAGAEPTAGRQDGAVGAAQEEAAAQADWAAGPGTADSGETPRGGKSGTKILEVLETAAGPGAAADSLLLEVLADGGVRAAVRSCAAAGAAVTLVPLAAAAEVRTWRICNAASVVASCHLALLALGARPVSGAMTAPIPVRGWNSTLHCPCRLVSTAVPMCHTALADCTSAAGIRHVSCAPAGRGRGRSVKLRAQRAAAAAPGASGGAAR